MQPSPPSVDGAGSLLDPGSDDEAAPARVEITEESLDAFYSDIPDEGNSSAASIDSLFQRPNLPPASQSDGGGGGPDSDLDSESLP